MSFPDAIVVIPEVLEAGEMLFAVHVVSSEIDVPEAVEVDEIVRGVATLIWLKEFCFS